MKKLLHKIRHLRRALRVIEWMEEICSEDSDCYYSQRMIKIEHCVDGVFGITVYKPIDDSTISEQYGKDLIDACYNKRP